MIFNFNCLASDTVGVRATWQHLRDELPRAQDSFQHWSLEGYNFSSSPGRHIEDNAGIHLMDNAVDSDPKIVIYQVLRAIPKGKVLTYGQVAHLAGLGRAARFVGTTLRKLPKDSALPWHRVINSQGKISLPEHHPSAKLQQTKLIDEGVVFHRDKVDLKTFLWKP